MAARRAQNGGGARASLSHFLGWVVPLSQEAAGHSLGPRGRTGSVRPEARRVVCCHPRKGRGRAGAARWLHRCHSSQSASPGSWRRPAGPGEVWEERGRSGSMSSTEAASPAPSPQGNLSPRAAAPPATLTQSVPPWHYTPTTRLALVTSL